MGEIHFATLLSPCLYETYEYISKYVGEKVGYPTNLTVGQSLQEIAEGQIDVAFACGLLYVQYATKQASCPIELLAAPVIRGERYQGKPIYFSDVVVRRDSSYTSFDDLEGCVWAYNERASHSGYNLVCYSLLAREKAPHYFGKTIETGSHLRSLRMVLDGQADVTAIDSHMLDILLLKQRNLALQLRVIDMLGPSSIPPVLVSQRLDNQLKCSMREVLVTMHMDPDATPQLHRGCLERFVPIHDEHYQDIRDMYMQIQAQAFLLL